MEVLDPPEEAAAVRKPFGNLDLGEDDDDDDADDDEGMVSMVKMKKTKRHKQQQQRRRRRSSARFLRLGSQPDDDDDDDEEEAAPESEQLGEMYKRAIRMNAENRINAGNSWNLRLIENIDKLIINDDAGESSSGNGNNTGEATVNFTKASCTLDASVKIYSYRVDDVHLTSYKVLANLNRNDVNTSSSSTSSNSNSQNKNTTADDNGGGETDNNDDEERTTKRRSADTLESNVANLNLNKLDSAYDIDPLFHKMSKTFDEGGARGLLLVNLGVGANGCNIVFDSKEEEKVDYNDGLEGMVDITGLTAKLDSLISSTQQLETLELVPQLRTLRQEYAVLEDEGFITHDEKKSRRYATSQEEEKEAEMSIHQDFLERSRMSAATGMMSSAGGDSSIADPTSHTTPAADDDDADEYAADDYGGDDDDDGDFGFDDFINNDANGDRYSSISFQNEPFLDAAAGATQTAALLDALCSSEMSQNDYEFFSQDTLEKLSQGNHWAGSQHWKKATNLRKKEVKPKATKKKAAKKKKKQSVVDFAADVSSIDDLLQPAQKNKRGTDPIQLSKAMKTKYSKADNVLPLDAGMGMDQLSKLFLRPTAVVRPSTIKTVGFHDTVSYGGFDDGSCGGGDDDDGPGFEFAGDDMDDNDEFMVAKLDVRKVEKVRVGYATVAKKVDVKRLKKDLWTELENNFTAEEQPTTTDDADVDEDEKKDVPTEEDEEKDEPTEEDEPEHKNTEPISFKETVQEMEFSQRQTDVSLPFYFICLLHLANEKGLRLESDGLTDFMISHDDGSTTKDDDEPVAAVRSKRAAKEAVDFAGMEEE